MEVETPHVEQAPVLRTFMDLAAISSPSRQEEECAEWVRAYLESLGLEVHEDDAGLTIPAGCGNIYTRIPGTVAGTPLFFCAHLDTVTLEDIVEPEIVDRGGEPIVTNIRPAILGSDNKAAVAVMLELARNAVAGDFDHAGLEFIFTPCEEVGLLGAKEFDTSWLDAKIGYVFDHSNDIGKIVVEAPTQVSMRAKFVGRAAHAGIVPEEGRSAIRAAADAIAAMPHGRISDRTTANVGMIDGGTATNIVPENCQLRAEVRSLDHDACAEVVATVIAAWTDAATRHDVDLEYQQREEYRSYTFSSQNDGVGLAIQAMKSNDIEAELVPCGGGSDANVFNMADIECVNLCNGMRLIHTSDEYIEVRDLDRMLDVATSLVQLASVG